MIKKGCKTSSNSSMNCPIKQFVDNKETSNTATVQAKLPQSHLGYVYILTHTGICIQVPFYASARLCARVRPRQLFLKIVPCCCRLRGCHGRGMWATRQLRSALQNRPKICYSNTHFPSEEQGWKDGQGRIVILTKLRLLYPVVGTVFSPLLPLFPFLLSTS